MINKIELAIELQLSQLESALYICLIPATASDSVMWELN